MSKFCWMTDIHLNVLKTDQTIKWLKYVKRSLSSDVISVCISGDISESYSLEEDLTLLSSILDLPVYFVLGNHDFWHSTFSDVENTCRRLTLENSKLVWLSGTNIIQLSDQIALVGHDGWYDARNGDWNTSNITMNDWYHIYNYHPFISVNLGGMMPGIDMNAIVNVSRHRADLAADHVYTHGKTALEQGNKRLIVFTHFPPFTDAMRWNGGPSEVDAFPWYSSKVMGDTLLKLANEFPDQEISVFCGHTHESCRFVAQKNLEVFVGAAQYGNPHWETFSLGAE